MNHQDDLEIMAIQERILLFATFDEDVAWSIGSALRSRAKKAISP